MGKRYLSDIKLGETVRIAEIKSTGDVRRRLCDMGFVPKTKVKCVLKSMRGSISAYEVRGAITAIRADDANNIAVESD